MHTRLLSFALLVFLLLGLACDSRSHPAPGSSPSGKSRPPAVGVPPGTVATVNGVPITTLEVKLLMQGSGHGREVTSDQEKNMLQTLIRQELGSQRAVKLGLDKEPALAERLAQIEAQAQAMRRRLLYEAIVQQQVEKQPAVTEQEVRAYYLKNGAKMRARVHIWQILTRDEASAKKVVEELGRGRPFDEVARSQRPDIPAHAPAFWDMGFMRWVQMPDPWRDAVARLGKGQTSGVISGPAGRYWVLRVMDRIEDPTISFEDHKKEIQEVLKRSRALEGQQELERTLQQGAQVVYMDEKAVTTP